MANLLNRHKFRKKLHGQMWKYFREECGILTECRISVEHNLWPLLDDCFKRGVRSETGSTPDGIFDMINFLDQIKKDLK